jgi:phage-related protein
VAEWLWVESAGTAHRREPRLREARFGDGYRQVAPDGLNHNPLVVEYQAVDVSDEEGTAMEAFLEAHGSGAQWFEYWPKWAAGKLKFTCKVWQRTHGSDVGLSNFTATFEQWFGP